MKRNMNGRLACRYCQHYSPEGRRGGTCQKLGVPVRGSWHACSLVRPSFMFLEDLDRLDKPLVLLDEPIALVPTPTSYSAIVQTSATKQVPA